MTYSNPPPSKNAIPAARITPKTTIVAGLAQNITRSDEGVVYVVDGDSKVAVRPVTVAQQDDTRAVISDGVKTQEQVVTTRGRNLEKIGLKAQDTSEIFLADARAVSTG